MKFSANLIWLGSERIAIAAILLISNVYVIRYLGPGEYGTLAVYQAILTLFLATSEFGVRRILVVLRASKWLPVVYSHALRIKIWVAAALAILLSIIMAFGSYPTYTWFILIFIATSPLEIYCYYFEGTLNNRPLAAIRTAAAALAAVIRIYLCVSKADISLIALSFVIPPVGVAFAARYFARKSGFRASVRFKRRSPSKRAIRIIASRGLYFWLSMVLIQLGLRVDVLTLTWISGSKEAGIYSASQKLFEQGVSLFAIAGTVALPFISKRRRGGWPRDLQNLYGVVFGAALLVCIPLGIFSNRIITFLYGNEFKESVVVFKVFVFALPFMMLANVSGLFYSIYRIERLAFFRNLLALVIAVGLQILFISRAQAVGAAAAVLITQILLCFVFEIFLPSCRLNVSLKAKALASLASPGFYRWLVHGAIHDLRAAR